MREKISVAPKNVTGSDVKRFGTVVTAINNFDFFKLLVIFQGSHWRRTHLEELQRAKILLKNLILKK